MLRPCSVQWLVFLVCGSLTAFGCSTDTQQSDGSGSLKLELVVDDGVVINSVSWTISGGEGEMEPMSGTIDTSAPGSTASMEVYGLPPGEGYLVELEAKSEDDEVSCKGDAEFGVETGVSTPVMVILKCKIPMSTGAARVNGEFNICAQLLKVVVSSLQTSVGNDINLSAAGDDHEVDPIRYAWTETGGSIADPNAASTTYTCEEAGEQTVTITISDDDFGYCMDVWEVPVTCVEIDLCDDVDCDDGNECTDNDCDSATGKCINEPVKDGTECDGGAGMCSKGLCVEVDRCKDVDCSSDNECVEDGECDPTTGMCIDGANKPPGTICGDFGTCDGDGNCKINTCAQLDFAVVMPLQTSVGNDLDLSATGSDEDDDPVAYRWTGTGGSIDDPSASTTTYTCGEVGEQTITIAVSDDDFEYCIDDLDVSVTCVDN